MSQGAYAADKALWHRGRIADLRKEQSIFPAHLHLIMTNICNQSCPGCAYRLPGYPSSETFNDRELLTAAEISQVLRDCKTMDCRAIEFTGGGEPTTHPQCDELMLYAQTLGLQTALITNGVLLDRVTESALASEWVRVSLDAANATVYGKTHAANSQTWEKVVANVAHFVTRKRATKSKVNFGVAFTVQRANWHQIVHATDLAYALGADNIRISALFTPEGGKYHEAYAKDAVDLAKEVTSKYSKTRGFIVHNRLGEKLSDLSGSPNYARCHYQQFTTYLGADGNLYRCCVTSYNPLGFLGNIRDYNGSLRTLWTAKCAEGNFEMFDARRCTRCQFNDRNAAIAQAVRTDADVDVSSNVVHPYFV
jgi:cyclic pyranopterin phosphate synthase